MFVFHTSDYYYCHHYNIIADQRLHGRYHSPLSRALAQFTGALGQVGAVLMLMLIVMIMIILVLVMVMMLKIMMIISAGDGWRSGCSLALHSPRCHLQV